MDASFWHDRWANHQLGFHEGETNSLLIQHFQALGLTAGNRVFVPFCGKTRDIAWLLAQGVRVSGAELSELAVSQLFDELGVEPDISNHGSLRHYRSTDIGDADLDIFVGDFFDLDCSSLGPVDSVYDRAALVALPHDMRRRYCRHLTEITTKASQLLITFEYDQQLMEGPPFSISAEEVQEHYSDRYDAKCLQRIEVPGGLKGVCPANECAWLIR